MLDAHYNGDINLANYWTAGDERIETLEPIPAGTTGETQPFQTITLRIIGFNHDKLENKIGNRSRSAVTIMTSALYKSGYMDTANNNINNADWSKSPRRAWCNNDFFNVLPSPLSKLIKTVIKSSYFVGLSDLTTSKTITTSDKVFLLSPIEISKYAPVDYYDDSTQYTLFKDGATDIIGPNPNIWLRDSRTTSGGITQYTVSYALLGSTLTTADPNSANRIMPAFCL